jgi:hypothetical protein
MIPMLLKLWSANSFLGKGHNYILEKSLALPFSG